jgi:hypothetical protein
MKIFFGAQLESTSVRFPQVSVSDTSVTAFFFRTIQFAIHPNKQGFEHIKWFIVACVAL